MTMSLSKPSFCHKLIPNATSTNIAAKNRILRISATRCRSPPESSIIGWCRVRSDSPTLFNAVTARCVSMTCLRIWYGKAKLSATVSPNNVGCWKQYETCRRYMIGSIGCPSKIKVPLVLEIMDAMIRNNVLFPPPDGPVNVIWAPAGICQSISCKICWSEIL